MAMNIDTGDEKARRSDLFYFVPSTIEVKANLNGRQSPVGDDKVAEMVDSLQTVGQLQPILVRRLPSKRVEVVLGYTRLRAAQVIEQSNPEFRLQGRVIECNDEEALTKNLVENMERNELTPIDKAFAARRFIEDFGWAKDRVAKLYRLKSTQAVDNLLALLSLPGELRERVDAGTLPQSAALTLVDMESAEAVAIVKEAEAAVIAEAIVETLPIEVETVEAVPVDGPASENGTPAVTPKKPSRSVPTLRKPRKSGKPMVIPPKAGTNGQAKVMVTGANVAAASRARGKKTKRTWSEIRLILKGRRDMVSQAILEFEAGELGEIGLNQVLSRAAEAIETADEIEASDGVSDEVSSGSGSRSVAMV